MYSRGVSEAGARPRAQGARRPRSGRHRHQGVLSADATAPTQRGLSRKHLFDAIDGSLRRLGTDYVDLYQIHRFDYDTPIEETLEALHDIVKAGKARYIGASSMYAWQFAKMLARVRRARLDAVRVDAEPLQPGLPGGRARDAAALPRGGHRRHPVEPAGARLSGRQPAPRRSRRHGAREDRRLRPRALLRRLATSRSPIGRPSSRQRRGVKPAQMALAWLLAQAGRHRADRRRVEAAAPRRGGGGARRSASTPARWRSSRSRTSRTRFSAPLT